MLSEKGFQSGCYACATKTNIILTSLAELRTINHEDLRRSLASILLEELRDAFDRAREKLPDEVQKFESGETIRSKFPAELWGRVSFLEVGLKIYRDQGLPTVIGLEGTPPNERRVLARTVDELLAGQRNVLERIKAICQHFGVTL